MNTKNIKILTRKRINEKLSNITRYPLTVVSAPMGFGKTTAALNFFENSNIKYIWSTMTRSIKIVDSEYFWFLITNSVQKNYPELGNAMIQRGFPSDSVQIARMIDLFKSQKYSEDIVIAIDDYYLIETPEIDTFIERLVSENIPKLHIVLITRSIPEIKIEELQIKGNCYCISADDLSFTEKELKNYFDLTEFKGDRFVRQHIRTYAGGWITAIYLMVSNYKNNSSLNIHNSINSMLDESFFNRYDDNIKDFLFKLSYFDIITPSQAAYMFDDPNIVNVLDQLCRENAFLALNSEGKYKLHQIFLDFLKQKRESVKIDTSPIFNKAGEWYSYQGDHAQAFKYWILAKNYKAMFEELEKTDVRIINSIDRKLIFQAFDYTDIEEQYKYPLATLKYIWLNILFVDKETGKKMLDAFDKYFMTHEHPYYPRNRILAESAIVATALAFNDAAKLIEYSEKARQLLNGQTSYIRNRNSVLTYGTPHFTYAYYKTPGEYKKVADILIHGFKSHIEATDGCGYGCLSLTRAEYNLETGKFDEVEIFAQKSLYKAKMWDQTSIAICAMMTLARYYIIKNKSPELDKIISTLVSMTKTQTNAIVLNILDNCLGYIYGIMGRLDKIPEWLKNGDMSFYNSNYQGMAFNYIVYGKAVLLQGNFVKLEVLCETFETYFSYFNNQLGYIHNNIHKAVAKFNIYGMMEAINELKKAFDIAIKDDIITPFVEDIEYIKPMLESDMLSEYEDFIEKIIQATEVASNMIKASNVLSSREIEVLSLIEAGESQKSIAQILMISPNTVKRHVQNIYQKLNASNKTLAIKKFHELNEK